MLIYYDMFMLDLCAVGVFELAVSLAES